MAHILIIDDDDQLRTSFQRLLTAEGFQVSTAASGEAGLRFIGEKIPDLVIVDIQMPGKNGLEVFAIIHDNHPRLPVIIMTAFGTTESAIEATKAGAFDYILKPFDIPEMLTLIGKALDAGKFMKTQISSGEDSEPPVTVNEAIIGRSPAMQQVYKAIGRVTATEATVLIRGESGTGKELVASAIYQHSSRSDKPFQIINCVAIPETLLESELFGYEKGAFTGAVQRRMGKIEQANGGTVFLDEIGDMPLSLQSKLLRLLQERSIERIGGRDTIPVDVRIIAATNRNLEQAIEEGIFREDLYYRLNVVSLTLPPLRERKGDISLLTDYFLHRFAMESGMENPGISDEARGRLEQYDWPGNIREFGNVLHKAIIFNRGMPVAAEDLDMGNPPPLNDTTRKTPDLEDGIRQWIRAGLEKGESTSFFDETMDTCARLMVSEALKFTGGNRSQAARLLGMSRPTLHARIDKYNLKMETSIKTEAED
ncbi:two-component system nitrogen regulation response regulator GlnG [Desulfobotulus alkaliphilus]|uniref:DNA-binding transcriptional regulator NtrC n=1 Tax=Desulfobotulus alkaliphilus TaxID=622671 RepID=A0A562RYI5_9BACT|nr:sigma-54 dependent transcriptional regulator [Desulfobotulus alkaliphilus]TWI74145.1 two-component system nitrogen regulation response regulator GlnG [Desulfobotulus alkaliphilus]